MIRRRGGGEADKDESGLRAGSDLGSGSPSGSTTVASEAVLTRKDIRDIARRSDMRQVIYTVVSYLQSKMLCYEI